MQPTHDSSYLLALASVESGCDEPDDADVDAGSSDQPLLLQMLEAGESPGMGQTHHEARVIAMVMENEGGEGGYPMLQDTVGDCSEGGDGKRGRRRAMPSAATSCPASITDARARAANLHRLGLSTDPLGGLCIAARIPKVAHQYVVPLPAVCRRKCKAGCTVGPHWGGLFYTFGVICIGTLMVVNVLLVASPIFYKKVCFCFAAAVSVFLFATGLADPGIVRYQQERDVQQTRYCGVCEVFPPEGSYHCEECGCCIEGYDHHCPWMGKCIGKGNMAYFILFNVTWMMYVIFVLTNMLLQ